MGGHGGLNILPQKKWNVYGRENRLRVARDEKEYAEKKEKERAERREREREARYRALCAKGSKNVVVLDGMGVEGTDVVREKRTEEEAGVERRGGDRWKREREQEAEERRGDPLTRTSDAAFDQSFRFAKGMQERPWWCGSHADDGGRGSGLDARGDDGIPWKRIEQGKGEEEKGKHVASRSCLGYVKVVDAQHETRMTEEKKKRRKKKKSKMQVYESLRQERLAREANERDKAEQVMMRYT